MRAAEFFDLTAREFELLLAASEEAKRADRLFAADLAAFLAAPYLKRPISGAELLGEEKPGPAWMYKPVSQMSQREREKLAEMTKQQRAARQARAERRRKKK